MDIMNAEIKGLNVEIRRLVVAHLDENDAELLELRQLKDTTADQIALAQAPKAPAAVLPLAELVEQQRKENILFPREITSPASPSAATAFSSLNVTHWAHDRNVAFDLLVTKVPVLHWNSLTTKIVSVPQTYDNMFRRFMLSVRDEFDEENVGCKFRLYSLPHNYHDIEQRKCIDSDKTLINVLRDWENLETVSPVILVWHETESPTKLFVSKALADDTESSVATNDSQTAACVKIRDNNTCLFCGYHRIDSVGPGACRIVEFKSVELLATVGLFYINEAPNIITLCTRCHKHFDSHCIGIHPVCHSLVIVPSIRSENLLSTDRREYLTLHGKKLKFNGSVIHRPPSVLLQHRYDRFIAAQVIVSGKKGKLKKITYYCIQCYLVTDLESDIVNELCTGCTIPLDDLNL